MSVEARWPAATQTRRHLGRVRRREAAGTGLHAGDAGSARLRRHPILFLVRRSAKQNQNQTDIVSFLNTILFETKLYDTSLSVHVVYYIVCFWQGRVFQYVIRVYYNVAILRLSFFWTSPRFVVLTSFLMLSLFVAVVTSSMQLAYAEAEAMDHSRAKLKVRLAHAKGVAVPRPSESDHTRG